MNFTYQPCPVRVLFGTPLIEALSNELPKGKQTQFWVVASSRLKVQVEELSRLEGVQISEHFSRVIQHVPGDQVQKSRHSVAKLQPDILLAIGGGSAIGLAKAVALKHPIPIWAVPTTYSGSEMTNIYGISAGGEKEVGRSRNVLPENVFYDPALSKNLPLDLATKSAMNAMAHLIEALYSSENNPFTYNSAVQGLEMLLRGMNELSEARLLNEQINEKFLFGACLAGKSLCEVSMGLHHKAAHVLGGSFGIDHASAHTVLLPYIFNYQWKFLDKQIQSDFRIAFGSDHPPLTLRQISDKLNNPINLQEIGFRKQNCAKAASLISKSIFPNPAPVSSENITKLLEEAFEGTMRIEP